MSRVKVKLDSDGIKKLLKSEEIAKECEKYANNVKARAGEGFQVGKRNYPERTGFAIYPETDKAKAKNYKENTLEKALRS